MALKIKNIFFLIGFFFLSSCSYYSFKGSLPAHIDNISVSPISNQSTEYIVTDILNEEIYNILLRENILNLVEIDNAKSKLDITIKSVTDKYYTYSLGDVDYEVVDEWKITIKAKVDWYDLLEDKIIFSEDERTNLTILKINGNSHALHAALLSM